jgi:glycosyltransferase involved in cell wall biosynthesis
MHLAGFIYEDERRRLDGGYARVHGYLTHRESVDLVRSADLLFLPMHDLPEGRRALTVPGKTYEYLASGRPILAAVPDGDARDMLERAGTAVLCRPADVPGIARVIGEQIERKQRGAPPPELDTAMVARYERRRLSERLAGLFDLVLGREIGEAGESSRPLLASATGSSPI